MIRRFFSVFLTEGLLESLRSSLLSGGVVLLLSSTGAWQYLASTLAAHDLLRAASWSHSATEGNQPAVILVDDNGYQNFFRAQSPVPREPLHNLLQTVAEHTRAETRITLDIDISPPTDQQVEQQRLEALILQNPAKWVLPAVQSGSPEITAQLRQWREALCARGVVFGLPYVPTEFGYPRLTHQYVNGLADASIPGNRPCADPQAPFVQKSMPLYHRTLSSGMVIPFSGDLESLAMMLDMLDPDAVVVGGAWGQTDIYGTPFGDRYGVMVHAAALAGVMNGENLAANVAQMLVAWVFVALASISLSAMMRLLGRYTSQPASSMAGHEFFNEHLKPFLNTTMVLFLLLLFTEGLSLLHVHTGYWVTSSMVGSITLGTMLLTWDWGRKESYHYTGLGNAWSSKVAEPVLNDIRSLHQVLLIMTNRIAGWRDGDILIPISRKRALFEGLSALTGLLMQTVFPLLSLLLAIRLSD